MPWTRHIMQTLSIPAVTQQRVSGDYQPSNSQWEIGDSTILAHAVGLAAFKDVSVHGVLGRHIVPQCQDSLVSRTVTF